MKTQLYFVSFVIMCCLLLGILSEVSAQAVGINTDGSSPDASSILDVKSTTKGMLIPRMTTTQRTAIASPAIGLLVFDSDTESFWFKDTGGWTELSSGGTTSDKIADADNDTKIEVEKNPDEDTIRFTVLGTEIAKLDDKTFHLNAPGGSLFVGKDAGKTDNGTDNHSTGIGYEALKNDSSGWNNTAVGYLSLSKNDAGDNNTAIGAHAMYKTQYGDFNVAIGQASMYENTSGANNVAVGQQSLTSNTSAKRNVAVGYKAMHDNTTGEENTAVGNKALYMNTDRSGLVAVGDSALFKNGLNATLPNKHALANTAVGTRAMQNNEIGSWNAALGYEALKHNVSGNFNVALGHEAMKQNLTGYENVAVGYGALSTNSTGKSNTAIGQASLGYNVTGGYNVAIGSSSLYRNTGGGKNVGIGVASLRNNLTGVNNTAIGYQSMYLDTTGSRNASMGYQSQYKIRNANNNTSQGYASLYNNIEGNSNVAIGTHALYRTGDRSNLVAVGDSTLYNNGTGASTADEGTKNTAIGSKGLFTNTTGYGNTVTGYNAMYSNDDGFWNVALGDEALYTNVSGSENTASGHQALYNNTGSQSTAVGAFALKQNTIGSHNTGIGYTALYNNNQGANNVALGSRALFNNANGSNNTIIGFEAGKGSAPHDQSGCVFLGHQAGMNESNSNKLYIDNSSTSSPLIYGDFSSNQLGFSADVGIGTKTPGAKLDVRGDAIFNENSLDKNFRIESNGDSSMFFVDGGLDRIGIGTSTPQHLVSNLSTNSTTDGSDGVFIDVQNKHTSYGVMSGIRFRNGTTNNTFKGGIYYQDDASFGRGNILFVNNNVANSTNATASDVRMIIKHDGAVGVGTTDLATGYKMSVDGKVICEELRVQDSGIWPDYVFRSDYPLPTLNEINQYIKEEGHLPGVPSEADIRENGQMVGDVQRKLLEKVEELTLHIIRMQAEIDRLKAKK